MPANPLGVLLRSRRAGHDTLVWARLDAPATFELTSPAFEHGAPIPVDYRGRLFGANVSPPLAWSAPDGTSELVLIVQDPDVPMSKPATHALAVIASTVGSLPDNGLASPSPVPGVVLGKGVLGRRGWAGPMPVRSHGPHAYVFQLYAADAPLGLTEGFTLADAEAALRGHALGRARLDGTYEIR